MNKGSLCISVCSETSAELFDKIREAEPLADVIELRFDCLSEDEIDIVLTNLPTISKKYLLTFRPIEQGGKRDLSVDARNAFWATATKTFSDRQLLIDHESDIRIDSDNDLHQTFISHHDFTGVPDDLNSLHAKFAELDGEMVKLAVRVDSSEDAVPLWRLLKNVAAQGKQIIPIAMGEGGKWTRTLGLAYGAFLTFAALTPDEATAPGQISAVDMLDIYRVKQLTENTQVYGILAGDTSYSMSPYIHNAAFADAAMDRVFVPLQTSDVANFIRRMVRQQTREVDLNFSGFSVTNPHKQAIIPQLDEIDETAAKIGAVNTVNIIDGKLHGYNTDAQGFIAPLIEMYGELKNAHAAVVGAGGAARACVYALKEAGADVTVFARDLKKAETLAVDMAVNAAAYDEQISFSQLSSFDIIVNTTPLGTRGAAQDKSIFTADELSSTQLVYDLVYVPEETRLLREAKIAGCKTLGGLEMLIGQAVRQFEIWTGETPSRQVLANAARRRLDSV